MYQKYTAESEDWKKLRASGLFVSLFMYPTDDLYLFLFQHTTGEPSFGAMGVKIVNHSVIIGCRDCIRKATLIAVKQQSCWHYYSKVGLSVGPAFFS
jgi:hypothetical protein